MEQEKFQDASENLQHLYQQVKSSSVGVMDYVKNDQLFTVAYAPIGGMEASIVIWVPHDVIASKAIAEENVLKEKTAFVFS